MMIVLAFLKSPLGKYLMIGLACLGLIVGFGLHERHAQYAKDQIHERNAVAAVQRDLDTCHANGQALVASLDAQNASIAAARADGDRRAKMLVDGLQAARAGRATAEARASKLLSHPPVGIDACARSEAARLAVLESLK